MTMAIPERRFKIRKKLIYSMYFMDQKLPQGGYLRAKFNLEPCDASNPSNPDPVVGGSMRFLQAAAGKLKVLQAGESGHPESNCVQYVSMVKVVECRQANMITSFN